MFIHLNNAFIKNLKNIKIKKNDVDAETFENDYQRPRSTRSRRDQGGKFKDKSDGKSEKKKKSTDASDGADGRETDGGSGSKSSKSGKKSDRKTSESSTPSKAKHSAGAGTNEKEVVEIDEKRQFEKKKSKKDLRDTIVTTLSQLARNARQMWKKYIPQMMSLFVTVYPLILPVVMDYLQTVVKWFQWAQSYGLRLRILAYTTMLYTAGFVRYYLDYGFEEIRMREFCLGM
ncbi:hypothetical protein RFI_18902, partial [Reticulomyxa filosa]